MTMVFQSVLQPIYAFTYSVEEFLKNTVRLLSICPFGGCKMLFHCGFNLHFRSEADIFSHMYWPFGFLFDKLPKSAYFSTGLSSSYLL